MEERIPMSEKDLKRLRILTEVKEGKTRQSKAARILGITSGDLPLKAFL
jgi:hypothetical protein